MRNRIQKIQLKVNFLQDRHPYLEDIRGHLKVLTLRDPLQVLKKIITTSTSDLILGYFCHTNSSNF